MKSRLVNNGILIFHGFWNNPDITASNFISYKKSMHRQGQLVTAQKRKTIQNLKENDFVGNSLTSSPRIMEVEKMVIIW